MRCMSIYISFSFPTLIQGLPSFAWKFNLLPTSWRFVFCNVPLLVPISQVNCWSKDLNDFPPSRMSHTTFPISLPKYYFSGGSLFFWSNSDSSLPIRISLNIFWHSGIRLLYIYSRGIFFPTSTTLFIHPQCPLTKVCHFSTSSFQQIWNTY